MEQRLYAFWEYDKFPFLRGGEVEAFTMHGRVRVAKYPGFDLKPVLILPYQEGLIRQEILNELEAKYEKEQKELHDKCLSELHAVFHEKYGIEKS